MNVTITQDGVGVIDGDRTRMAAKGETLDQPDDVAEALIEKGLAVAGIQEPSEEDE